MPENALSLLALVSYFRDADKGRGNAAGTLLVAGEHRKCVFLRGAFTDTALSRPETTPPFWPCQIISEGKPDEALSMLGLVGFLDANSRSPHLFVREHCPLLRIKMPIYGSFRVSFLQKSTWL